MSRQRTEYLQQQTQNALLEDELTNIAIPTATIVDENFIVPDHAKGREITRKYVLQWDNSLTNLAARPNQATWCPQDGHYDCFQTKTRYAPGCQRSESRRGNLEQVIMIGMKIKKVDSTFPCQLGLSVYGCKGNYYLSSGEQYNYIISPCENNHNMNEIILLTNPYVNSEYLSRFPGMTASALRNEGIMHVPHEDYVFVDQNHPIIDMIAENAKTLQIDLDSAELVDARWFKVDEKVVETCLNELETELINNLPIFDMTKFNAKICRPYDVNWESEAEVCDKCPASQQSLKNRIMTQEYHCTVVLEMTYVFM
jgi:hypothetical protein